MKGIAVIVVLTVGVILLCWFYSPLWDRSGESKKLLQFQYENSIRLVYIGEKWEVHKGGNVLATTPTLEGALDFIVDEHGKPVQLVITNVTESP